MHILSQDAQIATKNSRALLQEHVKTPDCTKYCVRVTKNTNLSRAVVFPLALRYTTA
jgi:hypothetical protein